jgi:hypothetical protein
VTQSPADLWSARVPDCLCFQVPDLAERHNSAAEPKEDVDVLLKV